MVTPTPNPDRPRSTDWKAAAGAVSAVSAARSAAAAAVCAGVAVAAGVALARSLAAVADALAAALDTELDVIAGDSLRTYDQDDDIPGTFSFDGSVYDAGGGIVQVWVARDTDRYPPVGAWVNVTSAPRPDPATRPEAL